MLFSGIYSVTWTCLIWMSWNVSLTWCILTHPLRNINAVHQAPPSAGNHGLGMRSVLLIITLQCTLCAFHEKICQCCMQSVVFEFHWLQNERSGKRFSRTQLGVQGFQVTWLVQGSVFVFPSAIAWHTPPIYPWSIKGKLESRKNPRMKVHTINYLKIEWFALWSILLKTIRSIKSSFCYHRRPSFFPKMQAMMAMTFVKCHLSLGVFVRVAAANSKTVNHNSAC